MAEKFHTVSIEELMDIDLVTVYRNLKQPYNVVFTDQTVLIPAKELILNRIVWEVFKKIGITSFPSVHNIQNFYIDGFFHSSSVKDMLEGMFKEVVERYVIPTNDRSILNSEFYKTLPEVYGNLNELIVHNNIEHVSSINILDLLELQFKPKLLEAIANANKHKEPSYISETYKVLDDIMHHDKDVEDNPLRIGYITKNFRIPQIQQMLACIGFGSEVNNVIFSHPITTTYVLGLQDAYEVGVTARDAIKACAALSDEIRTAEYTSRTLQMVTSNFMNVVDGDCGSTDYYDWFIQDSDKKLKEVVGKYYLNEETGKVEIITPEHKHLRGTFVKLRHINGCKHKSPRHCCFVCYGISAVNYPYLSRIGHANAAEAMQIHSQKTISTKHHVGTSNFLPYELPVGMDRIFKVFKNKSADRIENTKVGIREDFIKKNYKYTMHIDKDNMKGIKDLNTVTNLDSINPSSITAIDSFYIEITNTKDNSVTYEDVNIGMNVSSKNSTKRRINTGFLRSEFLKFIINDGVNRRYYMDNAGKYVIDITDWNFKEPIFEFKLVQVNSNNFIKDIKELLARLDPIDADIETTISSFSNILNDGYDIPFNVTEALVAGFVVKDPLHGDYSCGRGISKDVANLVTIIKHWSLGAVLGYEKQTSFIFDYTMFGRNINNHLLDGLLCPQEVYEEEKAREEQFGKRYAEMYFSTYKALGVQ